MNVSVSIGMTNQSGGFSALSSVYTFGYAKDGSKFAREEQGAGYNAKQIELSSDEYTVKSDIASEDVVKILTIVIDDYNQKNTKAA